MQAVGGVPTFRGNMIKNSGDTLVFSEKFELSHNITRLRKPEDHSRNLQHCENPISFLRSSFLLSAFI